MIMAIETKTEPSIWNVRRTVENTWVAKCAKPRMGEESESLDILAKKIRAAIMAKTGDYRPFTMIIEGNSKRVKG